MTNKHKNYVKEKINSGEVVFGVWSILNSAQHCEVMAEAGLDFQILDLEHGFFDLPSLEACIRACEIAHCSPLVRPSSLSGTQIQSSLDLGAHGIVVPQVFDVGNVADVVMQTNFHPKGRRGFNPFTRAGGYCPPTDGSMPHKLRPGFGLTSIIIENEPAYQVLDQILEVPDLDMVYLGVYDMSMALGCPGDVSHPKVKNFVRQALPRIRQAKKAAGVMVKSESEMKEFLDLGANVLVYGVDSFILSRAIHSGLDELKRALT